MKDETISEQERRSDSRRSRRFSLEILTTVLGVVVSLLANVLAASEFTTFAPLLAIAAAVVGGLQALFVARVRRRSSALTKLKSTVQAAYVGSLRVLEF